MSQRIRNHRLRFEKGQELPTAGESYITQRSLSGRLVLVTIKRVRRVFDHPDGATLMDADVVLRDLEGMERVNA